MGEVAMTRAWAMPNAATFRQPPIAALLARWLDGRRCIVDPFCGRSGRAHYSNDLRATPEWGVHSSDALEWLPWLRSQGVRADAVLLDPPYSPRQLSEHYRAAGIKPTRQHTQNARFYRLVREELDAILDAGGVAISCGWSSTGFGKKRGYELREMLLVHHGGAHHDTIVTVEEKCALASPLPYRESRQAKGEVDEQ